MTDSKYAAQIARDTVLNLLSDAEVAKVSTAEGVAALHPEEEFVDLGNLELGVQQADSAAEPTKTIISRQAVSNETWNKIVAQLGR
jgi:hypothetical protein